MNASSASAKMKQSRLRMWVTYTVLWWLAMLTAVIFTMTSVDTYHKKIFMRKCAKWGATREECENYYELRRD